MLISKHTNTVVFEECLKVGKDSTKDKAGKDTQWNCPFVKQEDKIKWGYSIQESFLFENRRIASHTSTSLK